MANYVGVKCPVCNKKFTQTDDIVVCPVCGAPHHRECYAEKGECVFVEDHIKGKEWQNPQAEQPKPEEVQGAPGEEDAALCDRCGSANPPHTIFCQVCGSRLGKETGPESGGTESPFPGMPHAYDPFGGVGKQDTIADVPASDLMFYVGPNSAYYLPRFYAMDKSRSGLMPNFSALLFTHFYCFYRKMYTVGLVLLGLYLLGMVPFYLLVRELPFDTLMNWLLGSGELQNVSQAAVLYIRLHNIGRVVNYVVRLLFCFTANRLYFRKAVGDVAYLLHHKAEKPHDYSCDYHDNLMTAGGVNKGSVLLLASGIFALSMIVSTAALYL